MVEIGDQRFTLLSVELEQLVDLSLHAIVILLGGWRTDIEEVSEANDLPEQLQEFRLPVFERVPAHLDQIGAELRLLSMLCRLIHEGVPAEDPVADD